MAPRKAATKATAARPRAVAANPADVPEELQDFYSDGPPKLKRARGAGVTGGYEPLQLSTPTAAQRRAAATSVDLEPLFYLDGVEYGIPAEFPPSLALVYLDGLDEGRDVASGRVLKLAIGKPGWAALMRYVEAGGEIGMAAMQAMLNRVMEKVMGAVDNIEGNG